MENEYNIADEIRRERCSRGLTQAEAAKLAGINPAQWANFEQGQRIPGSNNLRRICIGLGVSADVLLGIR